MSRALQTLSVSDPDDPRIGVYRAVRDRDLVRGQEGAFIAEGRVVVRQLLNSARFQAASILVSEAKLPGLAELLEGLVHLPPVYLASQPVLDAIIGFPLHRGLLAEGIRPTLPTAADLLAPLRGKARVRVVGLMGVSNHDNLGGVFRNAAAFGADAVLLDASSCDPLYRKAIRVSVGAVLTVPWTVLKPGEDMVSLLAADGLEVLSLSPSGAQALSALDPPDRAGMLFGTEGPGLPGSVLARTRTLSIPMARGFDSLNLATTSGIVLHKLSTSV